MNNSAIILSGNLSDLGPRRLNQKSQHINDLSFSITIADHTTINDNDSYTIVTPNGSTITVNANANTTTGGAQTGDATLTFDHNDGTNELTAANLKTALDFHDELVATVSGAKVTVTFIAKEPTVAAVSFTNSPITVTATSKNAVRS